MARRRRNAMDPDRASRAQIDRFRKGMKRYLFGKHPVLHRFGATQDEKVYDIIEDLRTAYEEGRAGTPENVFWGELVSYYDPKRRK